MKKIHLGFLLLFASTALVLMSFVTETPDNPCGVFSLGKAKIELSKGERSAVVMSKDALVDAMQAGPKFAGTGDCKGTYEITDLRLRIATAKEDVNYDYDFQMIRKMQSMEDYLLVRFFNDAQTLYFSGITVKDASGSVMQVPDVSYTLQ